MRNELEKLDPAIVDNFRRTGKGSGIPAKVQEYILHLDRAIELFRYDGNVTRCASKIAREFGICFNSARSRLYDAINMFHLNNTVKNEAWDQYYADKLENLAQLAVQSNDWKTAEKIYMSAHRLRTARESDGIDPQLLAPPTLLMTNDISIVDLNVERRDMRKLSRKYTEMEYYRMINGLPIEKEDRDRLMRDAEISDAEFVEV
ncbi:MAG: hypothetical protein Q8M66_03670 [Actinomycetota bacterium]|nr:hypothetical protein [Actinomycetota bacterium]